MAKIIQKDNDQLIVKAFPKLIAFVVLFFLAVFWIAVATTEQNVELSTYLIFNGVALGVISFLRYRLTCFDKRKQTVLLTSRSVFGAQTQQFSLAEVDSVKMSYGRGAVAKGGAIHLVVDQQTFPIVDSDIGRRNRERNVQIRDSIASWLAI